MSSRSASSNTTSTTTNTHDMRVAADNGSTAISSKGGVKINVVADEAFELGSDAIAAAVTTVEQVLDATNQNTEMVADSLNYALRSTIDASKSEAGQIGEQLVKVAIPAAVLAFVAANVLK